MKFARAVWERRWSWVEIVMVMSMAAGALLQLIHDWCSPRARARTRAYRQYRQMMAARPLEVPHGE